MPVNPQSGRLSTVYIHHGGGPLPLLGEQPHIAESLTNLVPRLPQPRCIVVISAHFETEVTTIMSSSAPSMLYDYYNFPPESYQFKYPAPGDPALADRIASLFQSANIPHKLDDTRGFDHGIFVPLMLMYPNADIPVVGISQPAPLDPSELWNIGKALSPLRDEGVLILGSGASFHNFDAFYRRRAGRGKVPIEDEQRSITWDRWMRNTVENKDLQQREAELKRWTHAPNAAFAHPTAEHFTPLLVVTAAAGDDLGKAVDPPMQQGLAASQFLFGAGGE